MDKHDELVRKVVDDIVQMHRETGIDLAYWNNARELVEMYYKVDIDVVVRDSRNE